MFCDFPKYRQVKSTIYRGVGGGGDATSDVELNALITLSTTATDAAIAAQTAQSAATTQAGVATTQAGNASASASAAAASASLAQALAGTAPSQAGNAGKFLTTNGTDISYAAVPYSSVTGTPTLATVATTGAYNDLTGKPTLGTAAATDSTAYVSSSANLGMKNKIIDGGFIVNQRGYVSGTALSAGSYGHDRWKAGAGGVTYTFTQGALGVSTAITITAGTVVQVIEGCNLPEGGTYVLSWTGTAQGRLNGGAYGASGTVTIAGWVAGTNLNVEFSTGTCGSVQLEKGSTATSFDYRPYGTELQLCQRYYYRRLSTGTGRSISTLQAYATSAAFGNIANLPVTMRATPTAAVSAVSDFSLSIANSSAASFTAISLSNTTIDNIATGGVTGSSGLAAGNATNFVSANSTGWIDASAEL
jgi:hypothetical protein